MFSFYPFVRQRFYFFVIFYSYSFIFSEKVWHAYVYMCVAEEEEVRNSVWKFKKLKLQNGFLKKKKNFQKDWFSKMCKVYFGNASSLK